MKLIGLDIGTRRIGVAKADTNVKIAVPAGTVAVDGKEFSEIARLARLSGAEAFVVGLPRSNEGNQTTQTAYVKNFARELQKQVENVKIYFQDESLTSVEAEKRLKSKKSYQKSGKVYQKGEVDAEAAAIILQDFLEGFASRIATEGAGGDFANTPRDGSSDVNSSSRGVGNSTDIPSRAPVGKPSASQGAVGQPAVGKPSASQGAVAGALPIVFSLRCVPRGERKKIDPESGISAGLPNRSDKENLAEKPAETQINLKKGQKMNKKFKKIVVILTTIIVVLGVVGLLGYAWYSGNLAAVYTPGCPDGADAPECTPVEFTVELGDNPKTIAEELEKTGLIKNSLVFQIYGQLSGEARNYQAGTYHFQKSMTTPEIAEKIARGETDSNVFTYTIIPGQNLRQVKAGLEKAGYSTTEVETAFSKQYDNPVLKFKPADATLEGYLYPDTYEFYKTATVEEIIKTVLEEMNQVVIKNNLEQKFAAQGLNLHQGITLASIVEEESVKGEYANVAAVFLNRLELGMMLGSDVTAKYAADLLDPNREIYTDNSLVLEIDSPYNTRKYAGLPPGPIANPSLEAMLGVAEPAENDYLFFLTGDDGLMYYSITESGHNQNAAEHCQELCNVEL